MIKLILFLLWALPLCGFALFMIRFCEYLIEIDRVMYKEKIKKERERRLRRRRRKRKTE